MSVGIITKTLRATTKRPARAKATMLGANGVMSYCTIAFDYEVSYVRNYMLAAQTLAAKHGLKLKAETELDHIEACGAYVWEAISQ